MLPCRRGVLPHYAPDPIVPFHVAGKRGCSRVCRDCLNSLLFAFLTTRCGAGTNVNPQTHAARKFVDGNGGGTPRRLAAAA